MELSVSTRQVVSAGNCCGLPLHCLSSLPVAWTEPEAGSESHASAAASVGQFKHVPLGRPFDRRTPLGLGVALAPHARENDDLRAFTSRRVDLRRLPGRPRTKLDDVCHRCPPNRWPSACGRPLVPHRPTPAHPSANRPKVERPRVNERLTPG
jgi:hypothetical protein